ncbi:MAG: toll/interleukin-1 receptor domain-containing protein [Anaerolineales bacterium]
MPEPRKLRVFLSCGIHDKPTVHVLYRRLKGEGWITPWLDDEDLLPGQDLELEIENELEAVDIALVCVSKQSLNEEGYFQKEIDSIAEAARKKPKDTVFIIPILLDYCELPRSLRPWLPVDFYPNEDRDTAYQLILKSLEVKHGFVTGKTAKSPSKYWVSTIESKVIDDLDDLTFGGFTFVKIPKGKFKMGSRVL